MCNIRHLLYRQSHVLVRSNTTKRGISSAGSVPRQRLYSNQSETSFFTRQTGSCSVWASSESVPFVPFGLYRSSKKRAVWALSELFFCVCFCPSPLSLRLPDRRETKPRINRSTSTQSILSFQSINNSFMISFHLPLFLLLYILIFFSIKPKP